jgi:ribosomal protein S18 acetylase RimI-like enzyme
MPIFYKDMHELSFFKATKAEAEQIATFVNAAYRGEFSRHGWTTEADLLDGFRTDTEQILSLFEDSNALFLLCRVDTELQGSVYLQKEDDSVHIGMLAVNPLQQNRGIGKALLYAAELTAQQTWAANRLLMSVIPCRHELIAYYQRRGYKRTGIIKEFPVNPALWTPKVADLSLEILEKVL